MDREGRDPLSLLDEIASTLALDVTPVVWPLGQGVDFRGTVDLSTSTVMAPNGEIVRGFTSLDDLLLDDALTADPVVRASLGDLLNWCALGCPLSIARFSSPGILHR